MMQLFITWIIDLRIWDAMRVILVSGDRPGRVDKWTASAAVGRRQLSQPVKEDLMFSWGWYGTY